MPPGYKVCTHCVNWCDSIYFNTNIPVLYRSASAISPLSKRGLLWPQIRIVIPSSITLRDHDFWSQDNGYSASV
jgi:hypothetical protein